MKLKLMRQLSLPLVAISLLLNWGCQSASVVAGNSLTAIGQSENAAMVAAAKAEVSGLISSNTWNDIANKHALFLVSYDAACIAASSGLAIAPTNTVVLAASVTNTVNSAIAPTK